MESLDIYQGILSGFVATQGDGPTIAGKINAANKAIHPSSCEEALLREDQSQSNPSPANCQRHTSGAMTLAVRRGVRADAADLVALFILDAAAGDSSKAQPALSEAFVLETLADPLFEWLVAIDTAAGRLALVGALCFKWLPSPKLSVLKKFKVSPSHRCHGLGEVLLSGFRARLEAEMREQNMGTARVAILKVWRKNEGAMRLYSRLGWRREVGLVLNNAAPRQYITLFLLIDGDRDIQT
jgi:ribosomal protein S18 acetylase RimI-like enzyme